jgi:hypothetical protein
MHEIGCKTNRKTRPVVPVTAPRLENAKSISFLKMFENSKIENFRKMPIAIYPTL